ncbi:MAG: hypothetical protein KGJ81_13000, partial [Alphaproteobacteria bacterium]|nr:hypothetical protein [Alphaproteobacteria bacterium]
MKASEIAQAFSHQTPPRSGFEGRPMLGALIIVFREVLEAALVIGVVAAAVEGLPHRGRLVVAGVGLGALGAALVASGIDV